MSTIIENYRNVTMTLFMNDHTVSVTDFKALYKFFEESYFSRVEFKLIYLNLSKTAIFTDNLNLLDFTGSSETIRSSIKH